MGNCCPCFKTSSEQGTVLFLCLCNYFCIISFLIQIAEESTKVERAPLLPQGETSSVVKTKKQFNKVDHYKNVVDTAQR